MPGKGWETEAATKKLKKSKCTDLSTPEVFPTFQKSVGLWRPSALPFKSVKTFRWSGQRRPHPKELGPALPPPPPPRDARVVWESQQK